MSRRRRGTRTRRASATSSRDVDRAQLEAIVEHARVSPLSADEHAILKAALDTLVFVTEELKAKRTSIARLRAMLFGANTEKTTDVLGQPSAPQEANASDSKPVEATSPPRPRPPGHGRNGAAAYPGAQRVAVPHPSLHAGGHCPECPKGRVYPLSAPVRLVRIRGVAPLSATVYEKARLRCTLCGEVFTAPSPQGVGDERYDASATAMVALLKYGTGLPFHRIERLEQGLGIPLPAATQWELVRAGAPACAPAHEELLRQAAQGDVIHHDDTTAKILELPPVQRAAAAADPETDTRTGVFTSGLVATGEGHRIAVFCTGVQHAGEHLADVLARRAAERPVPIQMCDGLARNTAGEVETLLANCLAHARRKYVEVVHAFPEACRFVLETLRAVYQHDADARQQGLSPQARLALHQEKSRPLMEGLQRWMQQQLDARTVEPNSGLGQAIRYMQKHWTALTLFLHEPGAPLDNNLCERALKKAILHRKNALFFKTRHGARIADLFMSLIHTAELNGANPFDYLTALLQHHEAVARAPADWMPWTYQAVRATLTTGPDPPR